jgi:hypothetical protein
MKKIIFPLCALGFFLIAAIVFYSRVGSTLVTPTPTATSTIATVAEVTVATTTLAEMDASSRARISYDYPVFALNGSAFANLNDKVLDRIKEDVKSFKQNVNNSDLGTDAFPGAENQLLGGSEVYMIEKKGKGTRYVSVVLVSEFSMVGAAHPGHTFASLVYDVDSTSVITLPDIFNDVPKALAAVSAYAKEQLDSDDIIKTGLIPEEANFDTFALTPKGFMVVFQEYQVASYAAGTQRVTVPWSELSLYLSAAIKENLSL